jgi:hypothetical protein
MLSRLKSRTAGEPGYDTNAVWYPYRLHIHRTNLSHRGAQVQRTGWHAEGAGTSRMEEAHEVVACAQRILTRNGRKKQARGDDIQGDTNAL